MAVTLTPAALQRAEQWQLERLERLARKASHFIAEPDAIHPGAFLVRNPKVPHRIELVQPDGSCTCPDYRIWETCKHSALVVSRHDAACREPELAHA